MSRARRNKKRLKKLQEAAEQSHVTSLTETMTTLMEAKDDEGMVWDVVIIESGLSKNRFNYPRATLEAANRGPFDGMPVFADLAFRHQDVMEKRAADQIGWISNPRLGESNGKAASIGTLNLLPSARSFGENIKFAWEAGKRNLLGFSINGEGEAHREEVGGILCENVLAIKSCVLDVVANPAAGGRFAQLVASGSDTSVLEELVMIDTLFKLLESIDPEKAKTVDIDKVTQAELEQMIKEAKTPVAGTVAGDTTPVAEASQTETVASTTVSISESNATTLQEQVRAASDALKRIQVQECKLLLQTKLNDAGLPSVFNHDLKQRFKDRVFTEADIDAAIAIERDKWSKLTESGQIKQPGQGSAEVGQEEFDRKVSRLDGFFAGQKVNDVEPYWSFKEAYCDFTGRSPYGPEGMGRFHRQMFLETYNGDYDSGNYVSLREAVNNTQWNVVFSDRLHVRLMSQYSSNQFTRDALRVVSATPSVQDFHTQRIERIGGYGDLATVSESDTYQPVTTPADEEESYSPAKRGGLETITFEAMVNDKVQAIRRVPDGLARAAARTLYKFVYETNITDNPTMGDSTALFAAGHGSNTASATLNMSTFDSAWQVMRNQTELTSGEVIGEANSPKFILVPNELTGRAERMFNPNSGAFNYAINTTDDTETIQDPDRFKNRGIEVITLDYFTTATTWIVVADPMQVETIEIGFPFGEQEPQLFVQNDPTVGSNFTADKITYKIRHIYGGAPVEWRSFYRGTA